MGDATKVNTNIDVTLRAAKWLQPTELLLNAANVT